MHIGDSYGLPGWDNKEIFAHREAMLCLKRIFHALNLPLDTKYKKGAQNLDY